MFTTDGMIIIISTELQKCTQQLYAGINGR